MYSFIGDYQAKIDPKGRFVLPSSFKKQLEGDVDGRFVIKKDIFEKCLVLYPMAEWERQVRMIRRKLNPYNRQHSQFIRNFYRGTAEVEMDASNRLLIPKRLQELVDIQLEVVIAGQDTKIEIWAKELYDAFEFDEFEFADMAESLLGGEPAPEPQEEEEEHEEVDKQVEESGA